MVAQASRLFSRMKPLTRVILIVICITVIAQSLWLWAVTGSAGFTRYRDPDRAAQTADAGPSLQDLFADTGLEDDTGAMPVLPNEFRLGLLPSGFDKHLLSVLTLAGPAGMAIVVLMFGWLVGVRSAGNKTSGKPDR